MYSVGMGIDYLGWGQQGVQIHEDGLLIPATLSAPPSDDSPEPLRKEPIGMAALLPAGGIKCLTRRDGEGVVRTDGDGVVRVTAGGCSAAGARKRLVQHNFFFWLR